MRLRKREETQHSRIRSRKKHAQVSWPNKSREKNRKRIKWPRKKRRKRLNKNDNTRGRKRRTRRSKASVPTLPQNSPPHAKASPAERPPNNRLPRSERRRLLKWQHKLVIRPSELPNGSSWIR